MPAPKPKDGEGRDAYLGRCVPFYVNEGREQDQAVAICSSLFEQSSGGNSMTVTTTELTITADMDDAAVLAAYEAICLGKYTADQLRAMQKRGQAMPPSTEGGTPGYPIGDTEDLDNAINAVGRGAGDHNAIRKHIIKNARRMNQSSKIPDNWAADGSQKAASEMFVEGVKEGLVQATPLVEALGGKPNPGTAKDKRLKTNRGTTAYMADAPPMAPHDFTDANGDGMCDICGMTRDQHNANMPAAADDTAELAGVDVGAETPDGIPFEIPFLCATNTPTGDGRVFEHFDMADLPMPFAYQPERAPAHDKAIICGRITGLSKTADENGVQQWSARGMYLPNDAGIEAAQLAASDTMPGVSIDADKSFLMSLGEDGTKVYHSARIRGAIQLQLPAFAQAKATCNQEDVTACIDRIAAASDQLVASAEALLASVAAPPRWAPPTSFFDNPEFGDPETDERLCPYRNREGQVAGFKSPMRILADGRVEGHIAGWHECHIGYPDACVTPPASATNYAYFQRGEVMCAGGELLPIGVLCFDTGHADEYGSALQAQAHYDDTGTIAAFVRCGEDEHGIWFSGVVRPDLTDGQLATFRATGPSGDWRREGGNLELVAALNVPTQGFPSMRTRVLVSDGRCMTLIAAGAEPVVPRGDSQMMEEFVTELATLRAAIAPLMRASRESLMAELATLDE